MDSSQWASLKSRNLPVAMHQLLQLEDHAAWEISQTEDIRLEKPETLLESNPSAATKKTRK